MKITYVPTESPNSGTLCNFKIGDIVDTVIKKMNELNTKMIEEDEIRDIETILLKMMASQ